MLLTKHARPSSVSTSETLGNAGRAYLAAVGLFPTRRSQVHIFRHTGAGAIYGRARTPCDSFATLGDQHRVHAVLDACGTAQRRTHTVLLVHSALSTALLADIKRRLAPDLKAATWVSVGHMVKPTIVVTLMKYVLVSVCITGA